MINQLLLYFLLYLVSLGVCYAIGYGICKLVGAAERFWGTLAFLLTGATTIVSLFAITRTQGSTVLIMVPILLVIYWLYIRTGLQVSSKESRPLPPVNPPIIVAVIFSFLLAIVSMVQLHGFPVAVKGYDYSYYARLSESIRISGIENVYVPEKNIYGNFHFLSIYHYYDLWFVAALRTITRLNPYLLYTLVVCPFYFFCCLTGIFSLLRNYNINPWVSLFLAVLLMAVGRIYLPFYSHFIYLSSNYYPSGYGEPPLYMPNKYLVLYPFTLAACFLVLEKKYFAAVLLLLFIGLMYVTVLPAIAGALVLLIIANAWFKWWSSLWMLGSVIIMVLLFYIFYRVQGSPARAFYGSMDFRLWSSEYLRTRINIFVVTLFQLAVIYFPIVLLLISLLGRKYWRESNLYLLLLTKLLAICGLGAWIIAFRMVDSVQLITNTMSVVNAVLIVLFATALGERISSSTFRWNFLPGATISLLVLLLVFRWYASLADVVWQKSVFNSFYSSSYEEKVLRLSESLPENSVGVYFKDSTDYSKPAEKYSGAYSLSFYHCLSNHLLGSINLSIYEMPVSNDKLELVREMNAVQQNAFYLYSRRHSSLSIAQSQVQFIKDNKIRYAVCTRNAKLPAAIQSLINPEKTAADSLSGERFYLFR